MQRQIKTLRNNRKVIFDFGKFDDWCVFVVEENGKKNAPLDVTYFTDLKNISAHYSDNKLYKDFIEIYALTNNEILQEVLHLIDKLTATYNDEHQTIIEQWFAVIYAGMIAEENKQFAVLKKRIKRLGLHQVLILNHSPIDAANFSKGKKWRELDVIIKPLGF